MAEDNNNNEKDPVDTLRDIVRDCRHGGPTAEEEGTPYFQAAMRFCMNEWTPLDRLNQTSSLEEVGTAIQQTVRLVTTDPILNQMRASPGTARYFGAIAVDAWFNNDMPYVKKFMTKGLFLDRLLLDGPESLLGEELRSSEPVTLAQQIQRILLEQDIRSFLQHLTRGSCPCIALAESLNELDETEAAKAARKQREIEQLPPVLKPESKFWKLKRKAAAQLKANRLEQSIELYKQALALIEKQLEENLDVHRRHEWVKGLADEAGRVESNISMCYAKMRQFEKALFHADEAVGHFPAWSKPHCRRAIALEGLARLEDADAAVCKALEVWEQEALVDDSSTIRNAKNEFIEIQRRVEAALEGQPLLDLGNSIRGLQIDADYAEAGAFTSGWGTGVLDTIATFLTPQDVARLEQTCRGFAAKPERRRRIALSSPLRNCGSMGLDEIEEYIRVYCTEKLDNPNGSLRTLVASTLPFVVTIKRGRALPNWFREMLDHSNVLSRNIIQSMCIGKDHLRKALCHWAFQHISCHDLTHGAPDDENILPIYQKDEEGQLLRLISWASPLVDNVEDPDDELLEIRDQAYVALSNLILSKGHDLRGAFCGRKGQASPISRLTISIGSVINQSFPRQWPCEKTFEREWNYSADEVYAYFVKNHPRVFCRWKAALLQLLSWAKEAEAYNYQITLINQVIVTVDYLQQHGSIQVCQFSLAVFSLKKCMESGGAAVVLRNLSSQRDVSEFIADYYSLVRLYNEAIPKLLAWHDRTMAQHNMIMQGLQR